MSTFARSMVPNDEPSVAGCTLYLGQKQPLDDFLAATRQPIVVVRTTENAAVLVCDTKVVRGKDAIVAYLDSAPTSAP